MKHTKIILRLTAVMFAFAMLISAAMPVYADTVIDYVLYTDIRTYINGVEISSYNINGYTAVVVEDLAFYGFDVIWNGSARTLTAKRSPDKTITGADVSSTSGGKVGDRAMPVYATDIRTYFDGVEFTSYNVGGKTIVYVDDLSKIYSDGYNWDYVWNDTDRTLSVVLSNNINETAKDEYKREEYSFLDFLYQTNTNNPSLEYYGNAYDKLKKYILSNGDHINYDDEEWYMITENVDYDMSFSIIYTQGGLIILSLLYNRDNAETSYFLNLCSDNDGQKPYVSRLNVNGSEEITAYYINAYTHNSSTELSVVFSNGDLNTYESGIKLSKTALYIILDMAESIFSSQKIGISLSDFGFKNYIT